MTSSGRWRASVARRVISVCACRGAVDERCDRGEQSTLAEEKADLEATLKSKAKPTKLMKSELEALTETHGNARRTKIVERAAAQAMSEADVWPLQSARRLELARGGDGSTR